MALLPSASSVSYIKRRIFVGGLPSGVTEEECKQCFEKFGRVVEVVLIYKKEDRRPRGFGFITFDSDDVVETITALRFLQLKDKTVEAKRAEPYMGPKRNPNTSQSLGLQLASPSSYNPFYYSSYSLPSSYDLAYYSHYFPYYSSCYDPFTPIYVPIYNYLPVISNYYSYAQEVGGPSVTINGDYYGSRSSIVPYNSSPENFDPVPISEVEATSVVDREGTNHSAASNCSNRIFPDKDPETVQDKFVDYIKDSYELANTEQNRDDLADSSKLVDKSEDDKVEDGLSLNCNGGDPCAQLRE